MDFQKLEISTSGPVQRPNVRHRAKFREDRSNRSRDMADFRFSRWRLSAILDLFYACWDHPRIVFGGLYDSAKFGCNRCSNFASMQILIFCTLSLKMPIHATKIGVLGDYTPKIGSSMNETPKRHILGRKHVVWRTDQISRRSVEPFQRYGRFSIFQDGGRRHLGFVLRVLGPPTKSIW